jgi:cation:H+ antiporter
MILVAAATSLPEIVTTASASLTDGPDLAVGNLFGSSMANMAILGIVDLAGRHQVWKNVEGGQPRLAALAAAVTAIATLAVLVPSSFVVGWVGADTIVIAGAYLAGLAWMRRSPRGRFGEDSSVEVPDGSAASENGQLRSTVRRFATGAILILIAAPVVTLAAEAIAEETGVGQTFVGTTLLAFTTSLPELVASLTALRIGAHDMAVGNLFGSNAFNMVMLLVADLFYLPGSLMEAVDPNQAIGGVSAMLLMTLVLASIAHGTETRFRRLEPDATLVLVVYLGCLYALWSTG